MTRPGAFKTKYYFLFLLLVLDGIFVSLAISYVRDIVIAEKSWTPSSPYYTTFSDSELAIVRRRTGGGGGGGGGVPNLIGYWNLDEGAGAVAADSSGNGNAGTLTNGPLWMSGRIGKAISFDGTDDYVNVPQKTFLDVYPITVAVWVKTSANGLAGIVNKYLPASLNGYQIFTNGGNLCAWYFKDNTNYVWDGTNCALSIPGVNDNAWHHIAFTVDGTGGKLYVDGVLRSSLAWTGTPGAPSTMQDISFGQYPRATTPYLAGMLDDIRIYNRALGASEIFTLYNAAPSGDTTLPAISSVFASPVGTSTAAIAWATNEVSNSQVEYGLTTGYGNVTALDTNFVLAHSRILSGLSASTLYHYRVRSRDAAGNLAVSGDFTFTTGTLSAGFPGGFMVKSYDQITRPRLSASQINSFVPAGRDKFVFPAPYNTEAVRLTIPSDCGGTDCVKSVGYSYWKNMNNHVASDTMYAFLGLSGNGGPTLFTYNKTTDAVVKVGPLFDAASGWSGESGEGWYFSATKPAALYALRTMDTKLFRYDVLAKTFSTVLDIASQTDLYGTNRYIWQVHSSDDDRVHIGTIRDTATFAYLGCFVYEEDINRYRYFPARGDLDECNLDARGRWLVILDNVDGLYGEDNRIIDLTTGTETVVIDQEGAAGHADLGDGYMVNGDNWNPLPAIILMKFPLAQTTRPVGPVVHYNPDWDTAVVNHVSHQNRQLGIPPEQQYACGGNLDATTTRENEIACFKFDGLLNELVVAPAMSSVYASGGGVEVYPKMPKGSLDVTGKYFIWTSNLNGDRLDAFIVKVPSQLLTP